MCIYLMATFVCVSLLNVKHQVKMARGSCGNGSGFNGMCHAAGTHDRKVTAKAIRSIRSHIKETGFDLDVALKARLNAPIQSCSLRFFNTPGLKLVENDSTVIAMVYPRPITGLYEPPARATTVLGIPPQVRAPTTPPPVQAPRVSTTIQPRRYRDRVIPLGDPTFSWRGPGSIVYPFTMDPQACFEVPVVLNDRPWFQSRRIVSVGEPSLIPMWGVPYTAHPNIATRVRTGY
jgi:hypothetical protein